jgi:hypothetical protein
VEVRSRKEDRGVRLRRREEVDDHVGACGGRGRGCC